MLAYQKAAINAVRESAKANSVACFDFVEQACAAFSVDGRALCEHVLRSPITLNFHPDRLSGNGKTVLENLLEQGQYQGQFRTGTTNGGKTAFLGGDRFRWEQRLFSGAYPQEALERPKYGALNVFRYADGACARFGSCFFTLKQEAVRRCTFAYGDSSTHPTTLCTDDTFIGILAAMLRDVRQNGKLLTQRLCSAQEALAILLNPNFALKNMGRNLEDCIEAHIHGEVSLLRDVDGFYVDESFGETAVAKQAEQLCQRYEIALHWVPKRQMEVRHIGPLFRGPKIPLLAQRVDRLLGGGQGIINAALVGDASRNSLQSPSEWQDLGDEAALFQSFKQLWHTLAYFG